jgi:signal transduction histidine kinase
MAAREPDERGPFIGAGLVTLLFFSLVAFTQWVTYSMRATMAPGALVSVPAAFFPSALVIVVFALLRGFRWSLVLRSIALVVLSFLASAGRLAVLRGQWGPSVSGLPALEELINGIVPPLLALVIGLYFVDAQQRTARIERLIAQREFEAQKALSDLEHEELRVRREVSESLHGHIQQRLVFVAASLAAIIPRAEAKNDQAAVEELRRLISEIDKLRDAEVRQLSHALYPAGVDIGLQQALQLQIRRIPPNIAVGFTVTSEAAGVDDVTDPEFDPAIRLLLVSALEEGITNAIKHGMASELDIVLDLVPGDPGHRVVVEIRDNGETSPDAPIHFSGLARLRARLESHGGGLGFEPGMSGARLRFWVARPARGDDGGESPETPHGDDGAGEPHDAPSPSPAAAPDGTAAPGGAGPSDRDKTAGP